MLSICSMHILLYLPNLSLEWLVVRQEFVHHSMMRLVVSERLVQTIES